MSISKSIAVLVVFACALSAQQIDWNTQVRNKLAVPNDPVTGTVQFQLAKINTSGNAINAGTSDTAVSVYIVTSASATTGLAQLSIGGQIMCVMDAGGAVIGDFIVASTTTAGRCHDAGAGAPTSVWVIGTATTAVIGGALAQVAIGAGYLGSTGVGGGVTNIGCTAPLVCAPNPIISTGTESCPTCDTSAAPLTNNGVAIGQGGQALATTATGIGTQVLIGGAPPAFGAVNLNTMTTGTLPFSGIFPTPTAQLQRLRIKANTGNLTTPEFATDYRFNIPDYNFPAQFPGGTLTAATPATVTLTPCPLGVATVGQTVYVSAGTGTAEAVKLTAGGTCTSGLATGTINFTPANTHTGGWAITSASAGTQEAVNAAGPNGGIVYGPQGVYDLYPPPIVGAGAVITAGTTIHGAGRFKTIFMIHSTSAGAFDSPVAGAHDNFEDIGIMATSQQVVGGFGVRLGTGTNENTFSTFNRIYCEPLYDCIKAVSATQWSVNDLIAYNFSNIGVIVNDTHCTDCNGPSITNSTFYNYLLATHAQACIFMSSSGATTIRGNKCFGSTGGQLQYNIWAAFPPNASPVTTQLVIDGNVLETVDFAAIEIDGTFNLVSITGNTIAQPGSLYNTYGLRVEDGGGSLLGTWQGTFTGNVIQGPGVGGSYYCAVFEGHSYNWILEGNTCNLAANGFYTDANIKATMGVNRFDNTIAPILGTPTNTLYSMTTPVTFAQMNALGAANMSVLPCKDCNATCTAGGSTGQICSRLNGLWAH